MENFLVGKRTILFSIVILNVIKSRQIQLSIVATSEDYKLLENMNKATVNSYQEMKNISGTIIRSIKDLDKRCKLVH